ncbi:hypothetical protein HDR63_00555, partial [bacterium]|nr:hypothetical protein [bacterium]
YQLGDHRFIRVTARPNMDWGTATLNNGHIVTRGAEYLIKIEPVTWLLDDKTRWAISHTALFSGIPFNMTLEYNGIFPRTFMARYMDQTFVPELTQSLDLGRFGPQDTVAAPNFEKLATDLAQAFGLGLTDIQLANMRQIIRTHLGGKYMQCFDDALLRTNPRLADRLDKIKKYHTR